MTYEKWTRITLRNVHSNALLCGIPVINTIAIAPAMNSKCQPLTASFSFYLGGTQLGTWEYAQMDTISELIRPPQFHLDTILTLLDARYNFDDDHYVSTVRQFPTCPTWSSKVATGSIDSLATIILENYVGLDIRSTQMLRDTSD